MAEEAKGEFPGSDAKELTAEEKAKATKKMEKMQVKASEVAKYEKVAVAVEQKFKAQNWVSAHDVAKFIRSL